ncbi:amidase family protein [Sphingosinicella soli]|uniref:Amidase n=1 Tax=Sphingosinicella soli TaxID=333708 RepID=A0A7W7AZ20_9SPHN|nr:amidase [Sphingosinicella soli]
MIAALDAHAQAALVRSGEVPPTALVEAAIGRIEAIDPALNAVCHRAFDHALQAARMVERAAPMAAVPYLLKASLEYPGFPMLSGSRTRTGAVGRTAYPLARRLDAAGLVPCGISTMPEFGLLGTGEALLYGPTRNPWDLARSSGGSSSGAAVAVAANMVPLATGSDGGGSIRIPAAHCGIIGFKPSRGWNVRARAASLIDDLLASDGLLGRSMRDTIWAAQFLRTQPPGETAIARPLRIAMCLTGLDGLPPDPAIAEVIGKAASLCETLGHHVEPRELPLDLPALGRAFDILWSYGGGDVTDLCRARLGAEADALLEPWTLGLARRRDSFTADDLAAALTAIAGVDRQLEAFWQDYDLVLGPVTSSTPPPLGVLAPDRDFDALWNDHFRHVNYTQLQNMAGYPGLSLPLFTASGGLPAGAMFWARQGADDLLLALGTALEESLPWADRRPPTGDSI